MTEDEHGHRPRYWQDLTKANALAPPSEELIRTAMKDKGWSREEAIAKLEADAAKCEYWMNLLYQVEVRRHGEITQLNVRRRDGAAIHDWRHLQRIKNELVGPECEGMEIYPAESRLVDTSNKFHLWVHTDPTYRLPVGFWERDVKEEGTLHAKTAGLRQRPR